MPTLAWPGVILYVATLFCSAICIVIPFIVIARSEKLSEMATRTSPIYLRFVTVIIVVWSGCALSIQGAMNAGISAIFGLVLGYVFGAVNRKKKPPPENKNENQTI